ncbi:RING-H2 finger protein ATL8 [Platanthera guangdongensis]|uniref:RING-H2 finger protein ATL8 n=1 Tax=Platanthera guangdongensis TaxID=2320717 RepID=A0ABR2MYQ3_9ASPA
MPPATRFLRSISGASSASKSPESTAVDSDLIVILAAMLCAMICVLGLALVARCAWLRRSFSVSRGTTQPPHTPNKGLKKKALQSLPKTSFDVVADEQLAECPICLAEFAHGDEIRILPQCGHGFHVGCVDMWLGSHSSCPSCRRILIVAPPSRCHLCGVGSTAVSAPSAESGIKKRDDGDANSFLP